MAAGERVERADGDDNGGSESVRTLVGAPGRPAGAGAAPEEGPRAGPAKEGGGEEGKAGKKAHAWELLRADVSSGLQTRLEWRCAGCLSDTFTNAPSSVGSHGSWAYKPGRRALQATWVPEDCLEALVQGVHAS